MKLGAAGRCQLAVLFLAFGGLALGLGNRLDLELLDRVGHLADFVVAVEAGKLDVEIADREFAHRLRHRDHRAGDIAADQERNHDAGERHHQQHRHQRQLLLFQPHPGTRNLAILAFAAARDQVVRQFLDIGKTSLRALDEQQRRAGIAVGHLDRIFRLLEITGDGRFELSKGSPI